MVTVAPFISAGVVPNLGGIVGSEGRTDLLKSLSERWSGGVVFGTDLDPLKDRYQQWTQNVIQPIQSAMKKVSSLVTSATEQRDIRFITSEEDLDSIPPDMWEPIMTDPVMRHYLENDQIYGFGLDPSRLPEEDVAGRLCYNGAVDSLQIKQAKEEKKPVYFIWEWHSDDPDYSFEELEKLRKSREYIRDVLLADMENMERDPTDPGAADVG